jgi:hypothetical protein
LIKAGFRLGLIPMEPMEDGFVTAAAAVTPAELPPGVPTVAALAPPYELEYVDEYEEDAPVVVTFLD